MRAKISSPVARYTTASLFVSLSLAVLVAYGLDVAIFIAPAMRAAAQQQLEQTIADEDRAFCEKFGMRVGTRAYTVCTQELAIIRQKQADRDSAAEQGFL